MLQKILTQFFVFLCITLSSYAYGQSSPNIIYLLTDDQDMELAKPQYMPNLHNLIRLQGAEMASFYTQLSECCPSRATILTGLPMSKTHIYHNGENDNGGGQANSNFGGFPFFAYQGLEVDTLATRLKTAGYWTGFVGSKYLNQYPNTLPTGPGGTRVRNNYYVPPGWSHWSVVSVGGDIEGFNSRFTSKIGSGQTTYDPVGTYAKNAPSFSNYLTDTLFAKGLQTIDLAAAANKPFFLHLSVSSPHAPSHSAPRHAACLALPWQAPRVPNFNEAVVRDKALHQQLPLMTATKIAGVDLEFKKRVCSMLAVDEGIQSLITKLSVSGQLSNTYFIFNSDNGYHLGNHRFPTGKRFPYEEDIRVPMLVRGPGITAGVNIPGLSTNVDLARTLLDFANVAPAPFMEGRSLKPAILEGNSSTQLAIREAILIERTETAVPSGYPNSTNGNCHVNPITSYANSNNYYDAKRDHLGLRTKKYTYIVWCEGERELYDNDSDPFQISSLLPQPAKNSTSAPWNPQPPINPAFLAEMDARITALRNCVGAAACSALENTPFTNPVY